VTLGGLGSVALRRSLDYAAGDRPGAGTTSGRPSGCGVAYAWLVVVRTLSSGGEPGTGDETMISYTGTEIRRLLAARIVCPPLPARRPHLVVDTLAA
jgi:hypothetical protein